MPDTKLLISLYNNLKVALTIVNGLKNINLHQGDLHIILSLLNSHLDQKDTGIITVDI